MELVIGKGKLGMGHLPFASNIPSNQTHHARYLRAALLVTH